MRDHLLWPNHLPFLLAFSINIQTLNTPPLPSHSYLQFTAHNLRYYIHASRIFYVICFLFSIDLMVVGWWKKPANKCSWCFLFGKTFPRYGKKSVPKLVQLFLAPRHSFAVAALRPEALQPTSNHQKTLAARTTPNDICAGFFHHSYTMRFNLRLDVSAFFINWRRVLNRLRCWIFVGWIFHCILDRTFRGFIPIFPTQTIYISYTLLKLTSNRIHFRA